MDKLMNLPKDYISVSQLNQYITCPEKYYRKYIAKEYASNNTKIDGLVIGSAFHDFVRDILRYNNIETPLSNCKHYFYKNLVKNINMLGTNEIDKEGYYEISELNQGYFKEILNDDDYALFIGGYVEVLKKGSVTRPALLEIFINLCNYFIEIKDDIFKELDYISSETKIEYTFQRYGKEFQILSYIDCICEGENLVVFDWKTAKRAWNIKDVMKKQDLIYSYIIAKNYDVIPEFRYVVFSYSSATGKIKHQIFSVKYNKEALVKVESSIHEVCRGINEKVFYKNEGSWACSFDYCEFYQSCQSYKNNVEVKEL